MTSLIWKREWPSFRSTPKTQSLISHLDCVDSVCFTVACCVFLTLWLWSTSYLSQVNLLTKTTIKYLTWSAVIVSVIIDGSTWWLLKLYSDWCSFIFRQISTFTTTEASFRLDYVISEMCTYNDKQTIQTMFSSNKIQGFVNIKPSTESAPSSKSCLTLTRTVSLGTESWVMLLKIIIVIHLLD